MGVDRLHQYRSAPRFSRGRGFTLLELMITGALIALLAAIAVPSYAHILEKQKIGQAERDLRMLALRIENYRTQHGPAPMSLNDLGMKLPKDPWGRDYQFLNFDSPIPGINGQIRKDHNLHPLNSEFDLYSLGADGDSKPPLTAKASRDDVIWARDGGFVGLAADY